MALCSSLELGFFSYEVSVMLLCWASFAKLYTRKKSDARSQPNADAENIAPSAALKSQAPAVCLSHRHESH